VNEFESQFGYIHIHAVIGKWREFLSINCAKHAC